MRLHVNLWAFAGNAPTDQQEVEVTIKDVVTASGVLAAGSPTAVPEMAMAVRQNPARGGADLQLALPADERVRVTIIDIAGRRVATLAEGMLPAGDHRLRWDSASSTPGIYFARLEAGGLMISRRIVILR
jgi:hypothetical protein